MSILSYSFALSDFLSWSFSYFTSDYGPTLGKSDVLFSHGFSVCSYDTVSSAHRPPVLGSCLIIMADMVVLISQCRHPPSNFILFRRCSVLLSLIFVFRYSALSFHSSLCAMLVIAAIQRQTTPYRLLRPIHTNTQCSSRQKTKPNRRLIRSCLMLRIDQ